MVNIENMDQRMEFSKDQIAEKVAELGAQITKDYKGKNLLIIPLMKGAFIFASDLIRSIDMNISIEFLKTSSYHDSLESSGKVQIENEINLDISKYDVLIVDDIVDTGITLKAVSEYISEKNPLSLKSCTFLDKPERREVEFVPDYCGYEIENNFVIGYGLNYIGDGYRNLPYIFSIRPKE